MRNFLISLSVSLALFLAWILVGAGMFTGNGPFSFHQGRFEGRVAGESVATPYPSLEERRDVSSDFRPIKRPGLGWFAVPTAHSAILLDVSTGKTMFEQDPDERRAIASITKLMTTMIVVERVADLDEPVTIDEEAVYAEGTRVGCPRSGYCNGERLHVGERISVRELLKAALMNSANDAAIALAKHVGGTQEGFVALMNRRAEELGLENSNFCTPSGLELDDPAEEERCYSSARDIARVAAFARRYEVLWKTMRMEKTEIRSVDGRSVHEVFNTNRLLGVYPNLIGTKTGFTPRAGYSLLAVAGNSEGHEVIAVVLNDPSRWQSVQELLSWGFSSYEWL